MSIPVISSYPMPQPEALPVNKVAWQLEARRAVLLVHDMQDYFLRFYGADSELRTKLVANIAALCAWARACGVPVVYTAQPVEQSAEERALLNDMWGPGLTTADPALQQVTAAVAPAPGDTVLVKWRYSAFQRSELQQLMRDWGRDQLLIVGVYAHIGCMTTALDAFMRDVQPFMVADALADFSEEEHRMALRYVAGRCGSVTHTAQVLAQRPQLSIDWLRASLLPRLEEGGFGPDDNLVDYGLDSLEVMAVVAEWQRLGLRVSFEELAGTLTLNAWWEVLQRKLAA
ncbi:bifunctional isochorismate lyase / aryl carrier protein [Duganella sp. CF458]|uniref:isochorismatase family protein n=1 Tax=Duganella sp. CF458 TaxID=1884368 RepID=UPI0008F07E01|nr:isochorismatase [Duganella sp. CF458]SFF51721.1 bifunctional isochorismate lyase / aryl carrier protein [Duganella sp. CF458]